MLNNNTQASVNLHNSSNIETSLHTNAELAPQETSTHSKSMMDKVKEAASNVGKQIGDAIHNIGNSEAKLQPILSNVPVVTPNELNDIPAHNQTEKPHWTSHPHTHEVNNSGLLNQGAFVGEVGSNILDKESVKHGVNPSDKVHFDAHPHTHDVNNSGLLNQSDVTANVRDASKPHWPVHTMPTDSSLNQEVYAQGSAPAQPVFVAHPDHSAAHAGIFDKVGSDQIAKQSELELNKESASHTISNVIEQGKEKLGQLGERIGEMGDKVKAAVQGEASQEYINPQLSTSANVNANVKLTH